MDCVVGWTLSVSRFNTNVHLFHKEYNSPLYLPLNILNKKVSLIEQFHGMYIVMGMQAIDREIANVDHVHSIAVKVEDG
jgi:hypothetical protein